MSWHSTESLVCDEGSQMSREIPKAFTPAGWDLVRGETIRKERQLSVTSNAVYQQIFDTHGSQHPPAGWAWFSKAGFCDTFDREKISKRRVPQKPVWDNSRSAGHGTFDEKARIMQLRHSASGRDQFLHRTNPNQLTDMMTGTIRSAVAEQPRRSLSAVTIRAAGLPAGLPVAK